MTDDSENETDETGFGIKLDNNFINRNPTSISGDTGMTTSNVTKQNSGGISDFHSIFGGSTQVTSNPNPITNTNGLGSIFESLGNLNLNPVVNTNNNNQGNDLLNSLGNVNN